MVGNIFSGFQEELEMCPVAGYGALVATIIPLIPLMIFCFIVPNQSPAGILGGFAAWLFAGASIFQPIYLLIIEFYEPCEEAKDKFKKKILWQILVCSAFFLFFGLVVWIMCMSCYPEYRPWNWCAGDDSEEDDEEDDYDDERIYLN